MQDVQVLRLDLTQRINNLPTEALRQVSELIESLEAQFVSLYQGETAPAKSEPQKLSPNLLRLQQMVRDEIGDEPIPGDEPFVGDVSWDKYLTLSDEEQGKLWDEASDIVSSHSTTKCSTIGNNITQPSINNWKP